MVPATKRIFSIRRPPVFIDVCSWVGQAHEPRVTTRMSRAFAPGPDPYLACGEGWPFLLFLGELLNQQLWKDMNHTSFTLHELLGRRQGLG